MRDTFSAQVSSKAYKKKCYRCGRTGHLPSLCHFKDQKCRCCGKFGHIAKVCNSQEATGEKQQRNYSSRPRQQQHSQQHSRHSRHTLSKLDMLTQKHLVMPHRIAVNGVYSQYNQQLSLVSKWT